MKPRRIFLVPAVVCLFVGYGTFLLAEKHSIGEADRKFLDAIVRQQSQDADTLSAPGRNISTASAISSNHPAVLRAELVVNSANVRRGELVVHSGIVKRKGPSITTIPQNSQAAAGSARRLN
jgi:hypothetical protein